MGLARVIWGSRARIYPLLDRSGMRGLLALLATTAARRETSEDVAIVHRGAWLYRCGDTYLSGSADFRFRHGGEIPELVRQQQEYARDAWFHAYEPSPGDVIVDVGAGVGVETLVFARAVGPAGRVLAIEAHPTTFSVLAAQVRANRLANVSLSQTAVTGRQRQVFIEDRELDDRNTIADEWAPGLLRDPVDGLPLDELCRRFDLERIDFVKMNIEGAEADAVAGMPETLARARFVCIACHDWLAEAGRGERFRTRAAVEAALREHGFEIVTRDDDPREYMRDHVNGYRI